MTHVRLILADDHAMVRQAIADLLTRDPHFSVVGQATDGHGLLQLARQLEWDIALLDVAMPGPRPEQTVAALREIGPDAGVVALTMIDDVSVAARMVAAGLNGFINKGAPFEELRQVLLRVRNGERALPDAIERALRRPEHTAAPHQQLTDQEWRVLRLLCDDTTPAAIARKLRISRSTVSTHLGHIRNKLGVDTNSGIVGYAERHGLI